MLQHQILLGFSISKSNPVLVDRLTAGQNKSCIYMYNADASGELMLALAYAQRADRNVKGWLTRAVERPRAEGHGTPWIARYG